MSVSAPANPPRHALQRDDAGACLTLSGTWTLHAAPPDLAPLVETLAATLAAPSNGQPGAQTRLTFDCRALERWDSALAGPLWDLLCQLQARGIVAELDGLPEGLQALLALARHDRLAEVVPPERAPSFVRRFGLEVIALSRSVGEIMAFFGEVTLASWRLLRGRARFRGAELWLLMQEAGADALPIIGMVSFLVGMILGYIADQQLVQFGARVYVAALVGLAMTIQIGALVTAIVLAGRTGAAFAAQLGTMQVNEEIDALRTLGIPPMEFLVLPRMLALILMTPLLAIYADLLGILGGAFVGTTVAGLTPNEYAIATRDAIAWNHVAQGLIGATVYGAIVAAAGCLRGMQCGRSAAAVGAATTSAVVTAIVFIVAAAAVLTILFDALGLA